MSWNKYSHLVQIDEETRILTIYRVFDDERDLYTSVKLPDGNWTSNVEVLQEFCRVLGENLLLDSPQARRLLDMRHEQS